MAVIKCESCGGDLQKNDDGTYTCRWCGTIQTVDVPGEATDLLDPIRLGIYNKAIEIQNKAATEADFHKAELFFKQVAPFRAAEIHIEQCRAKQKELHPVETYEKATALYGTDDIHKVTQAAELFGQISDYKDAADMRNLALTKKETLYRETTERLAREAAIRRKRNVRILLALLLAALAVGAFLVIKGLLGG